MQGEEQAQAARRYDRMFAAEPTPSTEWNEAAARKAPDEDAFAAELRGSVHDDFRQAHPDFERRSRVRSLFRANISPTARKLEEMSSPPPISRRAISPRVPDRKRVPPRRTLRTPGPRIRGPIQATTSWRMMSATTTWTMRPQQGGPIRLRPWHAVAVVALLASSLLAWGFAKRGGVIGGREIAVINAPDGPAKVLPAADADASVDKPEAAVLDRHENAPVKRVVSHQEQAVEPKVESRANYNGAGETDADGGRPRPRRPQPKKIKTVSVRPDGSLITNAEVPPAVEKAAGAGSRDAAAKHASTTPATPARPSATPRADKAAKPKATQKVAAVEPDGRGEGSRVHAKSRDGRFLRAIRRRGERGRGACIGHQGRDQIRIATWRP